MINLHFLRLLHVILLILIQFAISIVSSAIRPTGSATSRTWSPARRVALTMTLSTGSTAGQCTMIPGVPGLLNIKLTLVSGNSETEKVFRGAMGIQQAYRDENLIKEKSKKKVTMLSENLFFYCWQGGFFIFLTLIFFYKISAQS